MECFAVARHISPPPGNLSHDSLHSSSSNIHRAPRLSLRAFSPVLVAIFNAFTTAADASENPAESDELDRGRPGRLFPWHRLKHAQTRRPLAVSPRTTAFSRKRHGRKPRITTITCIPVSGQIFMVVNHYALHDDTRSRKCEHQSQGGHAFLLQFLCKLNLIYFFYRGFSLKKTDRFGENADKYLYLWSAIHLFIVFRYVLNLATRSRGHPNEINAEKFTAIVRGAVKSMVHDSGNGIFYMPRSWNSYIWIVPVVSCVVRATDELQPARATASGGRPPMWPLNCPSYFRRATVL